MKTQEWAARAEIVASLAVILTLVFVIYELRQNTLAIERQTGLERVARMNEPYLSLPELRAVHAKIKDKDGQEEIVQAFIDEYELTHDEALLWARYLQRVFAGLATDYELEGPSRQVEAMTWGMVNVPDGRLYWDIAGKKVFERTEYGKFANSLQSSER